MVVGRVIGWLLVLAGLAVLASDFIAWAASGEFHLMALGELWYRLSPSTLQLAQPAIQRHLYPALWDPVIVTVLLWWAAPTLLVLGFLLVIVFRKRRVRRWR
jgi:hypothetical protein